MIFAARLRGTLLLKALRHANAEIASLEVRFNDADVSIRCFK